jgi:hypothetical protein
VSETISTPLDIQPKTPYLSFQILITEPKQAAKCYFTGSSGKSLRKQPKS